MAVVQAAATVDLKAVMMVVVKAAMMVRWMAVMKGSLMVV